MKKNIITGWDKEAHDRYAGIFRELPWGVGFLTGWNRFLTIVGYVVYPILLFWLFARRCMSAGYIDVWNAELWHAILVPLSGFIALSFVRTKLDKPRPYEVMGIDPIIKKNTKGKSFPSRHVYSVTIIALAWLRYFWPAGIVLLLASIDMALARVIGGVHWPRDVLAALGASLVWGIIGFWVL